MADPGICRWTAVHDPTRLGIAVFENTAPAYLLHPEHGASGVAPGTWLVRRQQERGTGFRAPAVLIATEPVDDRDQHVEEDRVFQPCRHPCVGARILMLTPPVSACGDPLGARDPSDAGAFSVGGATQRG